MFPFSTVLFFSFPSSIPQSSFHGTILESKSKNMDKSKYKIGRECSQPVSSGRRTATLQRKAESADFSPASD
jgi:hypothetical protein